MRLINADTVVHWQSYDDEHETFPEHTGTIAEFLDAMTDEGCPESVSVLPSALQEAIRRIETKVDEVYGYPKTEYAEGYVNACKAAIKMLKSLAPVDAVPVVTGTWKAVTDDGERYKRICTCCGKEAPFDELEGVYLIYPHCPWCGADMRKDGDHAKGAV